MFEAIGAYLAAIGINVGHLVAGLCGAFTRMVIKGEKLTWELVSGSIVGALCAIYLAPVVARWIDLDVTDIATNNGLAFAIGMIGLSIAEGLVKAAQQWSLNPKIPHMESFQQARDAFDMNPEKTKKNDENAPD